MLVDSENIDELISMRYEMRRLRTVIADARRHLAELRKKSEDLWGEVESNQRRLPFDEAEAAPDSPPLNGHMGKRRGAKAEARA